MNLTPHAVTLRAETGDITIPASGYIARVSSSTQAVGEVSIEGVSVPIVETRWGALIIQNSSGEELELQADTLYIVSAVTAQAATPELRARFVVPTDFIRDADGRIIAARALSRA